MSLRARFEKKVDRSGDCHVWTAANNGRYGKLAAGGGSKLLLLAHRVAWELEHGPIPEGLVIDHLCGNTLCVRTSHLEPVTPLENWRRNGGTHCGRGHEFTPENTYRDPRGWRRCRRCHAEDEAKRRAS